MKAIYNDQKKSQGRNATRKDYLFAYSLKKESPPLEKNEDMIFFCGFQQMRNGLRRGISGSFFLSLSFFRSQVVIKKPSNDNFFGSKMGIE